jgi:hypothetical protein
MSDFAPIHDKLTAIATAHADYIRAAFEANKAYVEKLAAVRAPEQAMQLTADHVKSACELFAAESRRIGEMYQGLFTANPFRPTTPATSPHLKIV